MKVSNIADLRNHSETRSWPAPALSTTVRLGEGTDVGVAGDSNCWDERKTDAVGSLCWSDNVCELDGSCRYTGLVVVVTRLEGTMPLRGTTGKGGRVAGATIRCREV